jgi:hypothetical protein
MNEDFKYMVIAIALAIIVCVSFQKYSNNLKKHNETKQQLKQLIK